jgi:hypothetical protein
MPAGAPPATPTLASASSIRCQPHCQSSRTTRSPRVHPDALTFAIRQTDRSDPRRPTSSSHAPWLNPHSACGSAGAPPTAISCLGAFWTPAASVGGGARHRRRPKTCTEADLGHGNRGSGQVQCESFEISKRAVTQRTFVSGAQDHAGGLAGLERFLPTRCAQAPTVAGFQSAKAKFRQRCRKIVATGFGKLEKRGGHDGTNRVAPDVLAPGVAAAVSKEPRHGVY